MKDISAESAFEHANGSQLFRIPPSLLILRIEVAEQDLTAVPLVVRPARTQSLDFCPHPFLPSFLLLSLVGCFARCFGVRSSEEKHAPSLSSTEQLARRRMKRRGEERR